jgi:2-polyprenyl-3-methyl-5-hydroxy-6-metoxy-1,4-benzoquinol methylase
MKLVRKLKQLMTQNNEPHLPPPPVSDWQKPFDTLRRKWVEVPTTRLGRQKTTDLIKLSNEELLAEWLASRHDITTGVQFNHRGWYHTLYADGMRGKKVLDVGSGFAIDSITFAQHGAKVTFVDLAASNLEVIRRLCQTLGLQEVDFIFLDNIEALHILDGDYDVIMAMGSLHHAPVEVIKPETQELLKHLKIGGRWLQLAYPKTRWLREGSLPFDRWGQATDGVATPWAEWYDLPKLLDLLYPARFQVVLYQEFHNSDFVWFDLLYEGS